MSAERSLQVAIVDDEPLARRRIRRLLSSMPAVAVAFEATDVDDLRAKVQDAPVDIVFPRAQGLKGAQGAA